MTKPMPIRALTAAAGLAVLTSHAAAQAIPYYNSNWNPNPWSRSMYGARVTNRIDTFSWVENGGTTNRATHGQDGGHGAMDANSHIHVGSLPYANTGGSASWNTASVHAYSESNGVRRGELTNGRRWSENYTSYTVAEFWDTLTLTNTSNVGELLPIQVVLNGKSSPSGEAWIEWIFQPYESFISPSNWNRHRVRGFNGTKAFDWDGPSDAELAPMPTYLFPGITQDYVVGFRLWAMSSTYMEDGAVHADFGNSAYFQMNVPAKVRMTSASGRFTPMPITPVPEPGTLAALGLGLAALGARRRRRSG